MWSYVDAWGAAAAQLGIEIQGPVAIRVSPTWTVEAPLLVKGFGAPRGTLVSPSGDAWSGRWRELHAAGFAASSFGPYADGQTATVASLIDVLSDWTWCGEGPAPAWIQPPPPE